MSCLYPPGMRRAFPDCRIARQARALTRSPKTSLLWEAWTVPRNVVTLSPRLLPLMTNARRDRIEARRGELYRYRRVEDRIEIARRRRGPAQPRARRPTAVWFSGTSRTATWTPERRSSPNWMRSIQNGVGRSRSVPVPETAPSASKRHLALSCFGRCGDSLVSLQHSARRP